MKKQYLALVICILGLMTKPYGQDIAYFGRHVNRPILKAKASGNNRIEANVNQAYLNYMQSDSAYFPLAYFTSYMFYMNSRYSITDTGNPMSNELLLKQFGVLFDTILDAPSNTGYPSVVVRNIALDSVNLIIGHKNISGFNDTIIVDVDSVDAIGYLTSKVLFADTLITNTSLSPLNNWLNPINLLFKFNNDTIRSSKFAIMVSYYGSRLDTFGFLPGMGYVNCTVGGSGPVPKETKIGNVFGGLRANSISTGYEYFFGSSRTIPSNTGNMSGIIVPCSNPKSNYWYLQDNPISAYIVFTNTTGIDELSSSGFSVKQNYPNPFNTSSQITYTLKKACDVEFSITDLAGREVCRSNYKEMAPGSHTIELNATQFGPGIYLYTFNVNGNRVTRKMVITQ